MKKSPASKALAKKKAIASEKKEGKLSKAQYKRHEKSESESYEDMEDEDEEYSTPRRRRK